MSKGAYISLGIVLLVLFVVFVVYRKNAPLLKATAKDIPKTKPQVVSMLPTHNAEIITEAIVRR